MTIYNPYSSPYYFQIYSTIPSFYHVTPTTGKITEKTSVKIIIRRNKNKGKEKEKFMIEMHDEQEITTGKLVIPVKFDDKNKESNHNYESKNQNDTIVNTFRRSNRKLKVTSYFDLLICLTIDLFLTFINNYLISFANWSFYSINSIVFGCCNNQTNHFRRNNSFKY